MNEIEFVNTGVQSIVGYWVECDTCHEKLTRLDDESMEDNPTSSELRAAVAAYHTVVTGHQKFQLFSVTRHLQCYICKENPPNKEGFSVQETWAKQHLKDTGHKFFAFSEN